jgi:hypothetical protein
MIIIIPGLLLKKQYYKPLLNKLQEAGFAANIIDLGFNIQGLKNASEIVKKQLTGTPEKHDIITHSFGGIILKYLIHHYPEIKKNISSIIFVSVPHGGSWQALFLNMVPAARELIPFRKEIKELSNVSLPEETVNFIAESELKVWPRKSGLLKDFIDIVIPDTNHDNIINSESFISKAVTFIKSRHDRIFL